MLGYLSADIICSEKRTVFRGRSSRKTVSFEEQIMSKDKYPSIFLKPNWGYCVYYPSIIFRNKRDLPVRHLSTRQSLSIGFQNRVIQYSFPEFRTDFASVKRICLGKKYNISVKGKHTFLIVWIQVADTIYKQLTVKNVNSVYEVDFLVFSGTALSTSRFISSSVTKANRSAILTLILMWVLNPSSRF